MWSETARIEPVSAAPSTTLNVHVPVTAAASSPASAA
jgi:hypothetical protein